MIKGLYARHVVAFIGVTSGILLIAGLTLILEMHYHFSLYKSQDNGVGREIDMLSTHFEQALVQSVIWMSIGGILLSVIVSLYVAKRITAPLLEMRKVSERMAHGELHVRTPTRGKDELAELGKSLNYLAEQLQRQEHFRKMMTADIAHDLRTPLATLKSHMEAIIYGLWEPTPQRLEGIYEEVERLIHLVGDLEQLTEMESPHFQLEMKPEDIYAVIRQAVEAVEAAFIQKDVQLSLLPHEPVMILVDRKRVVQIFVNLLSNALKYTPAGGRVDITIKEKGNHINITISDTGIGISPEDLPYVFERFYRADKSRARNSGGSGIGLTIVNRLVDAHGGDIRMESIEGKGTKVTIQFRKSL